MNNKDTLTVKQLNLYVKSLLENDLHLINLSVTGEISGFKNHYSSGHWYFTLKDADSSVKCVMFKNSAIGVKFVPEDGMKVTVGGNVSLYEKEGQYQFYVSSMQVFGEGELYAEFERIKKQLNEEGLFNPDTKRPLPEYPKRIAVVTAATGAAVHDIINIMSERYPLCEIVLCPVLVQGLNAADDIVEMLEKVYSLNNIDLIILGRGGGSKEDLSVFNDEKLARKIYESPVPVISAVGHETDFSISDFVADFRASTPSHAAQVAVPDKSELLFKISALSDKNAKLLKYKYGFYNERLNSVMSSGCFKDPFYMIKTAEQNLDLLVDKIENSYKSKTDSLYLRLSTAISKLDALSPLKTLSRGFAGINKNSETVKSVNQINTGDIIDVTLYDGKAECLVQNTKRNK